MLMNSIILIISRHDTLRPLGLQRSEDIILLKKCQHEILEIHQIACSSQYIFGNK
jgi:hypothetical protein